MPATLTLEPAPAHHGSNGRHQPHRHDHPQQKQQHQPRPHVPDPSLLIQQYIDPGNAQSYLDLAREHGLDLDELIAFFDHPDTLRTLDGLDRINRRRAQSLAAAAHPQALQALTQITYLPTHGVPAATIEAVRKSSTTLAHLAHDRGTSRHAEDEPPPPLSSSSRSTANPRVSPSPDLLPLRPRPEGEGWGRAHSSSPLLSHSRTTPSTPTSRLLHRLAQSNTPFTPLTISAPRKAPAA